MSQKKKNLFLMYQRQIKQKKKTKINKNLLIFLKNKESKKK